MIIAIASGKGGTGKTTVATNLASILSQNNHNVQYLDCDVEEPNGHLFLKPEINNIQKVNIPIPQVDDNLCTGCGTCNKICEFSAIMCLNKKVIVFPELCHGCGGCMYACPEGAITERQKEIGVIEQGLSDNIKFIHGRLNISEPLSPPLIKRVKEHIKEGIINILDVPPGTSCPVVASIRGVDFVVLVTEPTPFGLNDLGLAIDMVRELDLPFGVVVNRHQENNTLAREFCKEKEVEILAEIPDSRDIAEAYSRGIIASSINSEYKHRFENLWQEIETRISI